MSTLSANNIRNSGSSTNNIVLNVDGSITLGNGGTLTLGTAQASTSGTSIDFTGIPSWAKRITAMFNGVSTASGSNVIILQFGTSAGIVNSGYTSTSTVTGSGVATGTSTTGLLLTCANIYTAASYTYTGNIIISTLGSNIWTLSSILSTPESPYIYSSAGGNTLASPLSSIRITTGTGTDTFDAGSINIMYEG